MHEALRVYSDKLVESADNDVFQKLIVEVMKKNLEVSYLLSIYTGVTKLQLVIVIIYFLNTAS